MGLEIENETIFYNMFTAWKRSGLLAELKELITTAVQHCFDLEGPRVMSVLLYLLMGWLCLFVLDSLASTRQS